MDAAIVVALITSCVSIFTVVCGAILKEYLSYRFKKHEFLRNRREKPYRKLIEMNFKMLQKTNSSEEYSSEEIMADFYEFGQELTLWGSAKAIKLWDDWRLAPNKGKADGKEFASSNGKNHYSTSKRYGTRWSPCRRRYFETVHK